MNNRVLYILLISIILLAISISILSISYSKPIYSIKSNSIKTAILNVKIKPIIYLKRSLLYNYKPYIIGEKVVENLVRNITLNYRLLTTFYNNTRYDKVYGFNTSYYIESYLEISGWHKEIFSRKGFLNYSNGFNVTVNISYIKSIVDIIGRETGIRTYTYKYVVKIMFNTLVQYEDRFRNYNVNPVTTIVFYSDKNEIVISKVNTYKEYSYKDTKYSINSLWGIPLPSIRSYAFFATILFSGSTLFLLLLVPGKKSEVDRVKQYSRRYGVYVVKAKPIIVGKDVVKISSIEDLFILARIHGLPILRDSDKLYLYIGDQVYVSDV